MSGDTRTALAELLQSIESYSLFTDAETTTAMQRAKRLDDAINAARALLAEAQPAEPGERQGNSSAILTSSQAKPVEPTDEELESLAKELDDLPVQAPFAFARAVLARWGRPAPVPQEQADA